jgi:hypothetical protein
MNWRHSVVVSVACGTLILGLPINKSNAAEKAPFVYFATSDPFLKPGEVPRRNDITFTVVRSPRTHSVARSGFLALITHKTIFWASHTAGISMTSVQAFFWEASPGRQFAAGQTTIHPAKHGPACV